MVAKSPGSVMFSRFSNKCAVVVWGVAKDRHQGHEGKDDFLDSPRNWVISERSAVGHWLRN